MITKLLLLISILSLPVRMAAQVYTLQPDDTLKQNKRRNHFVLFGHQSDHPGVASHRPLHHGDSTHHLSFFGKHKDTLAYHQHHFKHLKKFKSGLFELHIKNANLREVFDDIIKETGISFTYVGSIDTETTMHLESFSIEQLVDEVTYQNGMIAIREQNRYIVYGHGAGAVVLEDQIIYKYSPRNIGADKVREKLTDLDLKAEVTLMEDQNLLILSGNLKQVKDAIFKIRMVDTEPKKVAVELLIVEYNHGNGFRWGFDITSGQLNRVSDVNYQPGTGISFKYDFLGRLLPSFKVNLEALVENNFANIVTNPNVIALNNEQAYIKIQETRYIPLQTATINGVSTNLQAITTGINLTVKPVIMTNDVIHLEVEVENSVFLPTEAQGAVNTLSNNLTSKVIARNGETLVIGGLITANESNGSGGFPLLSRIPLLGLPFKNKSNQQNYLETVIYITPYINPLVVREYEKNEELGTDLQKRLDNDGKKLQRRGNRKF